MVNPSYLCPGQACEGKDQRRDNFDAVLLCKISERCKVVSVFWRGPACSRVFQSQSTASGECEVFEAVAGCSLSRPPSPESRTTDIRAHTTAGVQSRKARHLTTAVTGQRNDFF